MIPEIIEQMRKELYDTKLCISDFEKYDLKTLEKTNEPFFLVSAHTRNTFVFYWPQCRKSFFRQKVTGLQL